MFKKLRNKLLMIDMIITSIVILAAFCIVYLGTYRNTKKEIERKLHGVLSPFIVNNAIITEFQSMDIPIVETRGAEVYRSFSVDSDMVQSFTMIVDSEYNVISLGGLTTIETERYTQEDYNELAKKVLSGNHSSKVKFAGCTWAYRVTTLQMIDIRYDVTLSNLGQLNEIVLLDISDSENTLNFLLYMFLIVGVIVITSIYFISYYTANRAIIPIEETWEKQKQFIADASHELKTPLTTIMTNYDVLITNGSQTIESQRVWLDNIKIGSDRMSKLINKLLSLAKVENSTIQPEKRLFNMQHQLNEIMQSLDAVVQKKDIAVHVNNEATEDVFGYNESIKEIMGILYENAVKYTNEGGSIDISINRNKKNIIYSVKNSGEGISQQDLPYIFDRFYRSDKTRSNDESSYGLGLSIAKSLSDRIGGTITVNVVYNEYVEFEFSFEDR